MSLVELGWNPYFENLLSSVDQKEHRVGRIISRHTNIYFIRTEDDEYQGEVSGRYYHSIRETGDFPVVGDWVLMSIMPGAEKAVIHDILPRKTRVSRNAAGTAGKREGKGLVREQVIAANIDTLFIVAGLDREYNLRRIERYLAMAYNSGATPVILLNKADLHADPEAFITDVSAIAFGVSVHAISAKNNQGLDSLRQHIHPGQTAAFMGSSGVGKSSIINCLLGYDRQRTTAISSSVNKGVHTTTHRELIPLGDGGIVLDNPGMRELTLWASDETVESLFQDIDTLAVHCRFNDCDHVSEPGCAVKQAIDDGELDLKRLLSYQKLRKEELFFQQRQTKSTDTIEKEKWRKIQMAYRQRHKSR
ncbi:MAG: ribosome small subunit-dependent GTPase A [Desulfobacteraceae bacterium]|nr:ribosome small subunit-dependent GTPase A [Desulfobacteraceae bacterium]